MTDAVVLLGRLATLARHSRLIDEAARRGLAPLAIVGYEADAERLARRRAESGHPLAGLVDAVSVATADIDAVLAAVRPLLARYTVRAVLSTGEPFLEPAGVLAALLDLPGPGWAASRICRNKLLQRLRVPTLAPEWTVVGTGGEPVFPAVVKPVGRFQSNGVRLVHDPSQLRPVDTETFLLEERITGAEFSVESLVQHGQVIWSGVTRKDTNEEFGNYFTEKAHTSPADELSADDETVLLAANEHLIARVGAADCMTHAEFRLTPEGRVVLMEVAARVPGDGITLMWELATGQAMEPALLDIALGVSTSYPPARRRVRHCYVDHPHGTLREVRTGTAVPDSGIAWLACDDRWPEPKPLPADAQASWRVVLVSRLPGDLLGSQGDSTQRCASVVVDAPLWQPIAEVADKALAELSITTE